MVDKTLAAFGLPFSGDCTMESENKNKPERRNFRDIIEAKIYTRIHTSTKSFLNLFSRFKKLFTFGVVATLLSVCLWMVSEYRSTKQANDTKSHLNNASAERKSYHDQFLSEFADIKQRSRSQSNKTDPIDLSKIVHDAVENAFLENERRRQEKQLNIESMSGVTKTTPPLKIFSEEPYGEFACFDYVEFEILEENENSIIYSNENYDPVVSFSFTYNKKTGEVNSNPDSLIFNPNHRNASYKNYLGYIEFIKSHFLNARHVFWDLIKDEAFIRTGPTIPVNLRFDHKGTETAINFVKKIIRIEHFIGQELPYRLPPSEEAYRKITLLYELLSDKTVIWGNEYQIDLMNREAKVWFSDHFFITKINGVRYRMSMKNYIVSIYDVPVELGMITIDFPASIINPSLEQIKSDKTDKPITVSIKTKSQEEKIVVYSNTHHSAYLLSDHPNPIFPKHPLIKK
jgi:hypothetical protein